MKQTDLIRRIKALGYYFLEHGSRHDIYTNGKRKEPVPRHKEIPEPTARAIIKRCEQG